MYENETIFVCAMAKTPKSFNNEILYMVYLCDSFITFHKGDRQPFDLNHIECNTGTWLQGFN